MRLITLFILIIQTTFAASGRSATEAKAFIGKSAPDFSLEDQNGKKVKLSDYKGKFIVLEWFNHGCPFVVKHYGSNNMQTIQKLYAKNEQVKWLTIVSSAEGKQGYLASTSEAKAKMKEVGSAADHLLRDTDGKVGQLYGAQTTPHMFIIDTEFKLQYMGAIDSKKSANPKDIATAKNYVTAGLSKLMLKEKPNPQKTKAYGCSVKY